MAKYLFIESRDPYESADTPHYLSLVKGVRDAGNEATLFLIQNGVLAARVGASESERLRDVAKHGTVVLADSFSLRERAIDRVVDGVRPADIGVLVEMLLTPAVKALWH